MCRAHGTGYESAIAQIELALSHQLYFVDIRLAKLVNVLFIMQCTSYAQIQHCPPKLIKLGGIPVGSCNSSITVDEMYNFFCSKV